MVTAGIEVEGSFGAVGEVRHGVLGGGDSGGVGRALSVGREVGQGWHGRGRGRRKYVLIDSYEVGAKEDARAPAGEEVNDTRGWMSREGADDPFGCGSIDVEIGVGGEEGIEHVEVFGPATHVRADEWDRDEVEECSQAAVVVDLSAIDFVVAVAGSEPGIGVGDMDHDAHALGVCGACVTNAPFAIELGHAGTFGTREEFTGARRVPEFGEACAVGAERGDVVEEALGHCVDAVFGAEGGKGDEANEIT